MSNQQTPPPRKGNYVKVLRNLHTEQWSKVQWKHQQECDLLEDMRNFVKQRCAVEKSYGEALQKIAGNYLSKKMPPINELNHEQNNIQWTVWSVWRTLLEETDKLAKARLAAVEIFQQQIADDAKNVRQNKLSSAKKNLDLLKVIQGEVQTCVAELDKLKKIYFDEEHVSHDARDKARDAEEKLKKKKSNIFQSISSLQKTSAKLGSRRDLCEEKSTQARNSYLLQLSSANAHQNRYFNTDLQTIVKTLDGGVYEKMADYFSILSRTELITCSACQNSYGKVRDQALTVNRDYDLACFVEAFPVLKQHVVYDFEPCEGDSVNQIDSSHGNGNTLMQQGRQYATRVVQETKKIRELSRTLQNLVHLKEAGHKVDPNDTNGPDLETKIDDTKNQIRRSETAKVKAEGRLECLRQGGIKVDEFLQDAEGLATMELQRSASQLSFRESGNDESYDNDAVFESSPRNLQPEQMDEDEDEKADEAEIAIQQRIAEMRATWQDPTSAWEDSQTSTVMEIPSTTPSMDPSSVVKCIALYSYTAQNPDELSMMENEELEVLLALSEGDGWVKARNYKGEEGFVPQNYLDLHVDDPESNSIQETLEQIQYEAYETEQDTESGFPLEAQISFSSVDYTYQPTPNDVLPAPPQEETVYLSDPDSAGSTNFIGYCRALYDYEAASEEELAFFEGDIIGIIRPSGIHGEEVDDGWWQGQLLPDGPQGVFPSLVVEECGPNGEELTPKASPVFDQDSAPPLGTPPEVPTFLLPPEKVIITQPTPDADFAHRDILDAKDSLPTVNEVVKDEATETTEDSEDSQITGLDGTQIIISAATPVVELEPEETDGSIIPKDKEESLKEAIPEDGSPSVQGTTNESEA